MLIHRTIGRGEPERLVQGSSTRVVLRDQWSVGVETIGYTDQGDTVSFRILMSHEEIRLLIGGSVLP